MGPQDGESGCEGFVTIRLVSGWRNGPRDGKSSRKGYIATWWVSTVASKVVPARSNVENSCVCILLVGGVVWVCKQ